MTNLKYHAKVLATGLGLITATAAFFSAVIALLFTLDWLHTRYETATNIALFIIYGLIISYVIGRNYLDSINETDNEIDES